MRGIGRSAINARKTHCSERGHALTPENTYITPKGGRRVCRECRRIDGAEYQRRKRREMRQQPVLF